MGVLMLMATAAPSAHAAFHLLTYYNFEDGNLSSEFPTFGEQATSITFDTTSYPGGNIGVTAGVGTTLNNLGEGTTTNSALDLRGNTHGTVATQYCFFLGGLTTTDLTDVTLSFAILSQGNGGQFTSMDLLYSTTGVAGTYTSFATDTTLHTYTTYTKLSFDVSALSGGAVNDVSGSQLFFEFCFTGSTNNAFGNDTFIDNIQVTALPEPSTYIGGLLGIIGICWYQRRWFTRFLVSRPA